MFMPPRDARKVTVTVRVSPPSPDRPAQLADPLIWLIWREKATEEKPPHQTRGARQMGLFVPVVDQERARFERGSGGDDAASRAHRAFHDPHSLHRGSRPEDDTERDVGSQYAKKGNLVKVDGKWVKPSKDRDGRGSKAGVSHELGSEPQRFIPEKEFRGARLGYYFAMGKHGLGYYADDPRLYRSNQWRDTWEELRAGDARARQARREETKAAREDRRDASAYDPHDYRGGRDRHRGGSRDRSRDRSHPYRGGGGSGGRDGRGGGVDDRDRRDRRRSRSGSRDRGGRGSPPREMTREEKEKAALERLAAKRAGAGGGGHRSRKFGDF